MAKPLYRQLDIMRDHIEALEAGGPSEPGGSAGVASFNSRTGTVTLGAADVTGALGFTPQEEGAYALTSHNHEGVYALAGHSHVIADVSGLQTALDGKQASGSYSLTSHNHTGVYAPVSHSHVIADVTGLQTTLDGKQASGSYSLTSHNHDGTYATAAHNHSGVYEPVISAGNTGQYWRGDKTWQTLPGGADPWAYIKLANDFTTNSASAVDVTGMAFTPVANTDYEFEAHLMCRTATATVGPRAGLAWPTGGSDGAASIYTPSSGTAETMVHGNINAALLAAVGGLPNTTLSYGAKVLGIFRAGASPSGTVRLQLASETAGTNVTIKAGSFLKYRTI